jgi:cytochrome oxidase Cu insertion factor (SCO1/SenC/PrrC family)
MAGREPGIRFDAIVRWGPSRRNRLLTAGVGRPGTGWFARRSSETRWMRCNRFRTANAEALGASSVHDRTGRVMDNGTTPGLLMTGMTGMGSSQGAGNSLVVSAFHQALTRQAALIFVAVILLIVAWNGLRSWQYRQAKAKGLPWPPPTKSLGPEPVARRVLRIGLGVLWLFDGLLQLQQNMPLGLPSQAIQPGAATSPGWVQHLVGFGVTAWTHHPAAAAVSAVWIQLGIGVFLLAAPRGRWLRLAGLVSTGWALVVWVFGESLGGLFSPGVTVLFGAPGAALIYAIAGGLIALPDRAWIGPRLGRMITAASGAFLLGMAVLQAWPGRGFWEGGTSAHPGTLAGMVSNMANTPQPHVLSSLVAWFASFDESHGWGVNLAVVLVLATSGLSLIWGRRRLIFPTLVALVVFGIADWVFIEDWGFWGGVGTDPNSMLPILLVAVVGYLAMVRPVSAVAPTPSSLEAGRPAGRGWWERIDSGYAGRLAASLGAVFIVLLGAAPMASASINSQADTVLTEAVNGPPAVISGPAPSFGLTNQHGRSVTLASLRGYTVALTFLDPVCTSDCPTIAQEFHVSDQMLGTTAKRVKFVAVVANPVYHSVSVVDAFDQQEGLDSQPNWLFLTGSTSKLQSVLNAYGISAIVTPGGGMVDHSDTAFVIDSHGNLRRELGADPGSGSADSSSFSSLLTSEIVQVMRS